MYGCGTYSVKYNLKPPLFGSTGKASERHGEGLFLQYGARHANNTANRTLYPDYPQTLYPIKLPNLRYLLF